MNFIDEIKYGNLGYKDKQISLKETKVENKLKELGLYDSLFEMHPPKNSDPKTKKELELIAEAVKNVSDVTLTFCRSAEEDLVQVFVDFLSRNGIYEFDKQDLDSLLDQTEPLLFKLKEHYNRSRPQQIAYYHNIDLNVSIRFANANHPAYPSGHSFEGYILAHLLAEKYPKHKKSLLKLGKNIGLSRIVVGLHYFSDHDFGCYLAKLILDNKLISLP